MALYIDTSFLLNIIYSEDGFEKNLDTFNKSNNLFSSILLEIETTRSLNLTFTKEKKSLGNKWLNDVSEFTDKLFSRINLKNVDIDIKNEIGKNKTILELKSLEATHLATALYIQKLISEELILCSWDDRFREVAQKCGLKLIKK
ncbi:DNA-binding protein [Leptospira kobayashii]|uniref:DNA-binding protein n=1 Tax=Leptospira kobayashii TaxID=1917830 RepID=A0ABN6KB28_9LEPT|nr:PIN domain-containing protein [Leptospira kobayashii]BDA77746.1 DNA-binding protein [Leptospira kobayashii]